jgi:hypothetical protein
VRNRYLRTIERRIEHLNARARTRHAAGAAATFERAELAMLHVARDLIAARLRERVGDGYATAFLLEEAAAHLTGRDPTLPAEELVMALKARARLLEQVADRPDLDPSDDDAEGL